MIFWAWFILPVTNFYATLAALTKLEEDKSPPGGSIGKLGWFIGSP